MLALANLDPRIHFAILGDYSDAPARDMPEDAAILAAARSGIEALNARLGDGQGDRFFLLHRARQWNPAEQTWMGWERKRGKLEEFNRLLRGATDTSFDGAGRGPREPATAFATASRSTPTRACRATRPGSSSASSRIRSTSLTSIRPPAGSPTATPSCSRG